MGIFLANQDAPSRCTATDCLVTGVIDENFFLTSEYFTSPDLPGKLQQQLEDRKEKLKTNGIIKNM